MSTDARTSALAHATEELLEEFTFGRIHEPQLGWLEEHLLICAQCQSQLDDIEEYKIFELHLGQSVEPHGSLCLYVRPLLLGRVE